MSVTSLPEARRVEPGSVLAIVAPSGPFDPDRFQTGVDWLSERYEVTYRDDIFEREGFLAGCDERRAEELSEALLNPKVDAVLCARGGYGATRILELLDPQLVSMANKMLVGFSDATALHSLWGRCGVRSLHAPMVASLGKASASVRKAWVAALENYPAPAGYGSWSLETLSFGRAEGRLFGGNLAVLGALLGTPNAPAVDGGILFIEDVGERPYRVDRLLTTFRQAGWFERCAGVVIGAFTEGKPGPDGVAVETVLREHLSGLGIPVVTGLPAGHIDDNTPLRFGCRAIIAGGDFEIEP